MQTFPRYTIEKKILFDKLFHVLLLCFTSVRLRFIYLYMGRIYSMMYYMQILDMYANFRYANKCAVK